jgi:hypothetical protein
LYILRIIARADGTDSPEAGRFILGYDPDYHQGRGLLTTTEIRRKARRFNDQGDAYAFWRQPSRIQPTRPDGQPNRPLTAYTVSIEPHNQEVGPRPCLS